MKNLSILFICLLGYISVSSQSLAQRLGYPADAKLLIIHSDDLGVSHSENLGSFLAMKGGSVNSASVMMPTPWVEEVAAFAQEYPEADLGLHLTMTCEWDYLKWRPVAPTNKVQSLINEKGFFYDNCLEFGQKADPKEAAIELRAQVELAYKMGIQPTHLDSHMGCLLFNSAELFESYLQIGRDYKIPAMVGRLFLQAASPAFKEKMTDQDIIIEKKITASPKDYEGGMHNYYSEVLNTLESGVNVLLIHTALNDSELQAMTIGQENWGANWRQQDFDFFTSKTCADLIEKNNIQLITWREIQKAIYD